MSNLLNKFLEQRALIDTSVRYNSEPATKEQRNVVEKPRPSMETVRDLIDAKPNKKAVMEFLKRKVAQYTDDSSDDD